MKRFSLHNRDCLDVLRGAPSDSVDAIVTDPPYGLSFMGKRWDYDVPTVAIWAECLRVLKPGGHLLSFGGSRTYHRLAVAIEDAGFEIRDQIMWVYGSGFPKSHNVSKAIDKAAGAEREVTGSRVADNITGGNMHAANRGERHVIELRDKPATPAAKQWDGWGSALKPAHEPIVMARKPLGEKTLAANVLKHGTGGINVDGCRVGINPDVDDARLGGKGSWKPSKTRTVAIVSNQGKVGTSSPLGRFPANLIHDGSDEVLTGFPNENARFFYCAKASKSDRDEGLDAFGEQRTGGMQATADGSMLTGSGNERATKRRNIHPTVKPTDLMAYLCRLVTPPGGVVLDPFLGSGSTGKAAIREGFKFIGIEREPEYFAIAEARISAAADLFS